MTVRPEGPADAAAIRAVHVAAFPSDAEAQLVDSLRDAGRSRVSLVADEDGQIVGHILFTDATIVTANADESFPGLALAPLAVSPRYQRRGIGSELMRSGIEACRNAGAGFIFVLGHPQYYPRFGFRRASDVGIGNEYGADDAFMILELRPGALPRGGGLAKWRRSSRC